jgi:hypothetical protein
MTTITFRSDSTGGKEDMGGSDERANVSSRSDSRGYYNARDVGQSYSSAFSFDLGEGGEFAVWLENNSTTGKQLVISHIGINCDSVSRFKLLFVSGAVTGGNAIVPTNTNPSSSNAATATCREGGTEATGLASVTPGALIDYIYCGASDHRELRLDDRVRLSQNEAIAIELQEGTTADISGVIFYYFE